MTGDDDLRRRQQGPRMETTTPQSSNPDGEGADDDRKNEFRDGRNHPDSRIACCRRQRADGEATPLETTLVEEQRRLLYVLWGPPGGRVWWKVVVRPVMSRDSLHPTAAGLGLANQGW